MMNKLHSDETADPYSLQRFVDAQEAVFDQVQRELSQGYKEGHWMWFIFPQLRGLGTSSLSVKFGIASQGEAKAYLEHPTLGARLRECTRLVLGLKDRPIEDIFGNTDALKFRSCMTLFAFAAQDGQLFKDALQKYFAGEFDPLTIERI